MDEAGLHSGNDFNAAIKAQYGPIDIGSTSSRMDGIIVLTADNIESVPQNHTVWHFVAPAGGEYTLSMENVEWDKSVWNASGTPKDCYDYNDENGMFSCRFEAIEGEELYIVTGTGSTNGTIRIERYALSIVEQPESVTATIGSKATFHVEATGSNLAYQWQYYVKSTDRWANLSNSAYTGLKTDTMTVPVTAGRDRSQERSVGKEWRSPG